MSSTYRHSEVRFWTFCKSISSFAIASIAINMASLAHADDLFDVALRKLCQVAAPVLMLCATANDPKSVHVSGSFTKPKWHFFQVLEKRRFSDLA